MRGENGFDPTTGSWNDSLSGDFTWSRNNFGEARPDVMSPFTYSISEKVWNMVSFLPGYRLSGNICGRYYANISVSMAMLKALGKSEKGALQQLQDLLGNVPGDLEIPTADLPRSTMLLALPRIIRLGMKEKRGAKRVPEFLATNSKRSQEQALRIQRLQTKSELISFWNCEIYPSLVDGIWLLGGATQPLEATNKLKKELVSLVGEADANALFSNLSSEADLLASLGLVIGVARVAQGKLTRAEYLEKYGHRGPHEAELSLPRPAEDPSWLDDQLENYEKNPVNIDKMLAQRRADFKAAWERLQERYPKRAKKLRGEIDQVGPAARLRETVRDELTRFLWIERKWALRVGELTRLGDDIFYFTIDEILNLLSGADEVTQYLPARKETYARYRSLPPYPMIIRGAFDPFQWAADLNRRNDVYDATAAAALPKTGILHGFAGAAGQVTGKVRLLEAPEQGDQLQQGEVLLAVTTNVGWTPIFPRAAAVITDVGAPLSHAAIVARELGIPAVVGCGSATTRLHTGDRVRVDGGLGTVEILEIGHAKEI